MGKFWKVIKVDNAIFQNLESFGNLYLGFTIYRRISKLIHVSNLCQLFLISSCLPVIIVINFSKNPRFFHVGHSRQGPYGFWRVLESFGNL